MTPARFTMAIALLANLTLAACGADEPAKDERGNEARNPQLQVSAHKVRMTDVQDTVIGTGTIAARQSSNIGVSVEGIVERIFVRVGDRVAKGDPLFRTRQVDYELARDELASARDLANAQLELAELAFSRVSDLHQRGNAPTARLDEARANLKVARAQAGMAAAKYARAEQNLADTIVRAPFEGVVTERYVDEGVYMSKRFGTGGSAIVQVQEIFIVAAIVRIPERHVERIGLGTPGRLKVDGIETIFESEIDIFNDRIDHRTRTIEVRLAIANRDYAIKPGLFVRAELFPEARRVLLIPRGAVLGARSSPHVFVLANMKASERQITVREFDAGSYEVLSGLSEGERVLAGPDLPRIMEGSPVSPKVANVDR